MKPALIMMGLIIHVAVMAAVPPEQTGETGKLQRQAQELKNARIALQSQLQAAKEEDVLFLPLWQEGLTIPVKRETLKNALDLWMNQLDVSPQDRKNVEQFASNYSDRYEYEMSQKLRDLAIDVDLIKMEYERVAHNKLPKPQSTSREVAMQTEPQVQPAPEVQVKKGPLPWAAKKVEQPKAQKANVSVDIEDVSVDSRLGYRRWDFTRVFRENNGVGVNLTEYELSLKTPITEAQGSRKGTINVRIEPNSELRRSGYMWLEGGPPKYTEEQLTGRMTMIFRGKDDNGNPVELKSVFRR